MMPCHNSGCSEKGRHTEPKAKYPSQNIVFTVHVINVLARLAKINIGEQCLCGRLCVFAIAKDMIPFPHHLWHSVRQKRFKAGFQIDLL